MSISASTEAKDIENLTAVIKSQVPMDSPLTHDSISQNDRFLASDVTSYLSHLDKHGYVVIAGVVSTSDVDRARGLLWDFLEERTKKWKRNNMWSWISAEEDEASISGIADRGVENGILHKGGAGQSEAAWFIREKVASSGVFQKIWESDFGKQSQSIKYSNPINTSHETNIPIHTKRDEKEGENEDENELISSFDAICVFRPWQLYHRSDSQDFRSKIRTISRPWFHVDQGRSLAGKKVAIQGFVTLYDQNGKETTGGLAILAGSHKSHDRLCKMEVDNENSLKDANNPFLKNVIEFPGENDNYLEINANIVMKLANEWGIQDGWVDVVRDNKYNNIKDQLNKFDDSNNIWSLARVVKAKAGDLVLWDSRTLHCNTAADLQTSHHFLPPPNQLLRAVVYTCMVPRQWATSDDIERRVEAYERGWTSSHWPCNISSRFVNSKEDLRTNCLKFYQEDLSMEKEGQRKFKNASRQRRKLIGI